MLKSFLLLFLWMNNKECMNPTCKRAVWLVIMDSCNGRKRRWKEVCLKFLWHETRKISTEIGEALAAVVHALLRRSPTSAHHPPICCQVEQIFKGLSFKTEWWGKNKNPCSGSKALPCTAQQLTAAYALVVLFRFYLFTFLHSCLIKSQGKPDASGPCLH